MKNALTVDLEEWFTVYNLAKVYPLESWDKQIARIEASTRTLLDLFDRYQVQATFFVLGWIADTYPQLIAEIAHRGHEIASHGYQHRLVKNLSQEEFREDLLRATESIQKACDTEVIGFRAPSFSVDLKSEWIFDTLKECGFLYDSSLFPVAFHPEYSNSDVPLYPFTHKNGLREFPMTSIQIAGINIPCSGGGYFRLLPYSWFKFGFAQRGRENMPAVFYLHPWEIDPGQPRVTGLSPLKKFRHYTNLDKTESRLEKLFKDFAFTSMRKVLEL